MTKSMTAAAISRDGEDVNSRNLDPFRASVTVISIACCLSSSIWALVAPRWCTACTGIRGVDHQYVAIAGIVFYAAVFTMAVVRGVRRSVGVLMLAASGAHLVFIILLLLDQKLCIPCIVTAGCAGMGALTFVSWKQFRGPEALSLFIACVVTIGILRLAEKVASYANDKIVAELVAKELSGARPPIGQVRLIVFSRMGCPFCEALRRDVLPRSAERFKDHLMVEFRSAPDQVAAPTLLFIGREAHRVIVGLPKAVDVDTVIQQMAN